jgi:ATP-binding cassette subfamily B protein
MINAMRSAILFLMLWLVASGNITLGEFFTLLFYSFAIFAPLSEVGMVATQYQEAKASMEALEAIMQEEPEREPDHPVDPGPLRSVALSGLGFRYQSRSDSAVEQVDINLQAGRSVAIVGPSGSGKSTLIKLLVGLYKPTTGTMEINGHPIETIDYRTVRNRIGYVSQETQLFAGTIRENLQFVKPSATDEECLAALAQAEALPIIERAGEGLGTKIGEGGIKVSGGERQRLAIARALLRRPDILIFDEATSSLDSATERAITQTIRRIEKENPNLMMVMVAHRLSTIAHADEIVVLEKGKIIERGNHDALLANKNLYFALWRQQSAVS